MNLKSRLKNSFISLVFVFIVAFICVYEADFINFYPDINDIDSFRTFELDKNMLDEFEEKYEWGSERFYDALTTKMIQYGMAPGEKEKHASYLSVRTGLLSPLYKRYRKLYEEILADIECFPVAEDGTGEASVSFDNSWGGKRTYGGERKHEGTDIMASNNERGYFPVVSMTEGIVENKGWLKLGGWRLGIRSKSGAYFYYAHLYDYAEGIEEGTTVKAGQLIGYMGDSGYSEEEGTVGNFDVHLHMGIYIDYEGKETSINPYYILKYYENKKRKFYNKS